MLSEQEKDFAFSQGALEHWLSTAPKQMQDHLTTLVRGIKFYRDKSITAAETELASGGKLAESALQIQNLLGTIQNLQDQIEELNQQIFESNQKAVHFANLLEQERATVRSRTNRNFVQI